MPDSKALSPEVQGLLEKVRSQAQEYSDAFEYFEKQKTEYENILIHISIRESDFANYIETVKKNFEEVRKKNIDYITKGIERLESEVFKNIRKYEELSEISTLKSELIAIKGELLKELKSFKKTNDEFSSKVVFEIDSVFNKFRIEFENKITEKIRELDTKITNNIENIELKLNMLDKFSRMNKIQSESGYTDLKNEVTDINRKVTSNLESLNNYIDNIREETRVFEKDVNSKVDHFEQILHDSDLSELSEAMNKKLTKNLVTYDKLDNSVDNLSQSFQKQINTLDSYIDDIADQATKNKFKMNLAIFIAICSIFGILIIFYLAFANIL